MSGAWPTCASSAPAWGASRAMCGRLARALGPVLSFAPGVFLTRRPVLPRRRHADVLPPSCRRPAASCCCLVRSPVILHLCRVGRTPGEPLGRRPASAHARLRPGSPARARRRPCGHAQSGGAPRLDAPRRLRRARFVHARRAWRGGQRRTAKFRATCLCRVRAFTRHRPCATAIPRAIRAATRASTAWCRCCARRGRVPAARRARTSGSRSAQHRRCRLSTSAREDSACARPSRCPPARSLASTAAS